IKQDLKLSDRIYKCDVCKNEIDRDYNASLNLEKLALKKIGLVQAEFTPKDLTALLDDLEINNLITSKVDIGIQQKHYL
ncbi:transposase, partial [Campylobacter coli]|nr:transposase [Campylobacter coli]